MIALINARPVRTTPVLDGNGIVSESDVEQKLLYPFLTHESFIGIPSEWVRTKDYMAPTQIDKVAGKLRGYVPDYSIWINGLPLVIVEAKAPDVTVQSGLREARLYAVEINKRYPPNVNPIKFILACNGEQVALSEWDSETEIFVAHPRDLGAGSQALEVMRSTIGKVALEEYVNKLSVYFESRPFFPASSFMGERSRISEQIGVNEFAKSLFPVIARYFSKEGDEDPDDVIERAYVTSDETTSYNSALDAYLKDRTKNLGGNQLEPVVTGRHSATGVSTELTKFTRNPNFYGRVQLIVGAVGAGKSIFIRRYYRKLMPREIAEHTHWAFINFNVIPPGTRDFFRTWLANQFIESFAKESKIDIFDFSQLQKIFSVELNRFDKGPISLLRKSDQKAYLAKKSEEMTAWMSDPVRFAGAISRHYCGERGRGLVIVFDNVDKRSRDDQLMIFEAAQWFRDITHALVLVNIRDTTFSAYKDEPPLDAFANAVNFYIRPPRFAQMIRKRLELVLETLPTDEELERIQQYQLESGQRIVYHASRLGEFLLRIYLSLFESKSVRIAAALEALVAKDARKALGMFGDILVSPHIPTVQITGAALFADQSRITDWIIIKSLMRGRYKFFNGASTYIRGIFNISQELSRPSHFLYADILEFLLRNRKARIDFQQEGFALSRTVANRMSQLGYDEEDAMKALRHLVNWGLVEPESLMWTAPEAATPISADCWKTKAK